MTDSPPLTYVPPVHRCTPHLIRFLDISVIVVIYSSRSLLAPACALIIHIVLMYYTLLGCSDRSHVKTIATEIQSLHTFVRKNSRVGDWH